MANTNQILDSLLMQRDALMTLMLAQCHEQLQQLALLATNEKSAVAALMLVGQTVGRYAAGIQPDHDVSGAYERTVAALSQSLGRTSSNIFISHQHDNKCMQSIEDDVMHQIQAVKRLLAALAPAKIDKPASGESRSLPISR